MERAAKKKGKEEEVEAPPEKSVEQLVLERQLGKYEVVPLIAFWAKELRKKEEHRHLTQNEILELAMRQVLHGDVDEKELERRVREAPPEVPIEEGAKLKK